jgi:G3E family GTPase
MWFSRLLREKGQDLLRSKGIIDMEGEDQRYVIQGVHMLMDGNLLGPWPTDKPRQTKLVFIGRNLDSMDLREGFEACKAA